MSGADFIAELFEIPATFTGHAVSDTLERLHMHYSEPQIVEAVFTITQYIAISKFGDALGVELEPVFQGLDPILHVEH